MLSKKQKKINFSYAAVYVNRYKKPFPYLLLMWCFNLQASFNAKYQMRNSSLATHLPSSFKMVHTEQKRIKNIQTDHCYIRLMLQTQHEWKNRQHTCP